MATDILPLVTILTLPMAVRSAVRLLVKREEISGAHLAGLLLAYLFVWLNVD